MPVTTTLKLPDDLKARITTAAQQVGKTPHAFMVDALQLQTELAERRQQFIGDALQAREEVAQYGLVYDADEVFSYLQARLEGQPVLRPAPTKL